MLLMTPGPTNIPEDIRHILAQDLIHHRSQTFSSMFFQAQQNMQKICKTNNDVLFIGASGTGVMEAAVTNICSEGDTVLVVETGFFGQRFREIATTYNLDVHTCSYTGGERYDVEEVIHTIESLPNLKAVYVTHHDTSTGVVNDIQLLGTYLKTKPNICFVVDSISGLVMHDMQMDNWGVDVLLGGVQKGFLLPPGLAFVALSSNALKAMERATLPRYYFNLERLLAFSKKGQTFSTPAISLIIALEYATNKIIQEGLEKRFEMYYHRRKHLEHELHRVGLRPLLHDENVKGNVVVPVCIPKELHPQAIVDYMEKTHHIMIIGGYGEFASTTVRIGIIGPITHNDITQTVNALRATIDILMEDHT